MNNYEKIFDVEGLCRIAGHMKNLIFILFVLVSGLTDLWAADCEELIVPNQSDVGKGRALRKAAARVLKKMGMADQAYVTLWETKSSAAKGPYLGHGETLVVGVPKEDFEIWMNKFGETSIGLGMYGLPEEDPGTAVLRVGPYFLPYDVIQGNRKPRLFKNAFKRNSESWGFTEVSFQVSKSEMRDILAFFEARRKKKVHATAETKGYEVGEVIKPSFNHSGDSLEYESCAAACTSFLSEQWLRALDDQALAKRLRKIRSRLNINYNFVAKRSIYENFRNPLATLVLYRTDKSDKDLVGNFIGENSWNKIRGLYKFAFMPDGGPNHEVGSYRSQRLTLDEYLED